MTDLRITRARPIFSDGRHNAFTGIAALQGTTYVTFRSGATHVSYDGAIRVLASVDLERWELAHTWEPSQAGEDLRDPTAVVFGGKLHVYFAGRTESRADGRSSYRTSMVAVRDEGGAFGEPQVLDGLPDGYWLWHVLAVGDTLYGSAYRRTEGSRFHAVLCRSGDGVRWEPFLDYPVPAGEVSHDVGPDGTLYALVRCDSPGHGPALCRAEPPYEAWSSVQTLVTRLGGPMVKRLEGGCLIVGRRWELPGRRNLRTEVLWLPDGRDLQPLTRLPSGGDTSYAAWLDLGPGRAVMSYYSAHAWKMDEPHAATTIPAAQAEHSSAADIYLADVSWPVG